MTDKEILQKAIEKYDINKKGEIFNKKRGNKLKPGTYNNGYKYISVYIPELKKSKKVKVHRLVAIKYLSNPENKPFINHKNCNPSDNRVENLEWCTQKENVIHGFRNGRNQWNKGHLSKSQIYRSCKKYPRKFFWMLTTNNFQVAKAFWGCEENCSGELCRPNWEYHLQQMVLEEEPLKYLEKFLGE